MARRPSSGVLVTLNQADGGSGGGQGIGGGLYIYSGTTTLSETTKVDWQYGKHLQQQHLRSLHHELKWPG